MPYPSLVHPEPLPLQQSIADPYLHRRHSNTVLSQSLWGLWVLVHKVCLSPLSVSDGNGVYSKCEFTPSTVLLGLLLCPWMWCISSHLLQYHSSKASVLWGSAFFTVQLSHPYMTIGKTMALTRWTFICWQSNVSAF